MTDSNESWVAVPDIAVRHIWKHPTTGEEIAVSPTFYEDSGTPIDGETGDDYAYVRTEIVKTDPALILGDHNHRYLSAERMTQDDFGVAFTMREGELVYDARTKPSGQWATMGEESWAKHGAGQLRLGAGQCYRRQADGQLWKILG